jgi:hypothetical protein
MDPFTIRRLGKLLDGYIDLKVPREVRAFVRLKYEWDGNRLTLAEERPDYGSRQWTRTAIAQFRLERGIWSVYALDDDGEWSLVPSITPCPDFERQLERVELDREGVFWTSPALIN